MRFLDFYLIEIKYRIFYFLISLSFSFIIVYFYINECLYLFSYPILETNMVKILNNDSLFELNRLIYTNVSEAFIINLKFSFLFINIISFFYLLFHIITFLIPSLYRYESKSLILISLTIIALFKLSLILIYYILIPNIWSFLVSFEQSTFNDMLSIKLEAKMSEYFSFIFNITFYVLLLFQFPLIIISLFLNKIIKLSFFKNQRKYIILISLIIGSLISPPDVFSQIILAIPIFLLYEFTFFCLIFIKIYLKRE